MPTTSFRIDPQTQELLRILNLPYSKVFRKGLIQLGLDGKIKDPRAIHLVKKFQQDLIDELEAEKAVLDQLVIELDRQARGDTTARFKPEVRDELVRPEHLGQTSAEWLRSDEKYATMCVRNILLEHWSPKFEGYNGDTLVLRKDIEGFNMDPIEREAWDILLERKDLDSIMITGLKEAQRYGS